MIGKMKRSTCTKMSAFDGKVKLLFQVYSYGFQLGKKKYYSLCLGSWTIVVHGSSAV
jgi:hypothetical protein